MKSKSIALTIWCALLSLTLHAQKLTSGYLYPAGGQVGTTVEIEAGGLNINKATKVVFNHPGIRGEVIPFVEPANAPKKPRKLNDQSSPQLADKVKIRISIAPNVPCGFYDLRLHAPQGVSNMLPFEVSSYPNIIESGKSTLRKPDQVASLPAVLCGQVTPGGIDYYRFAGHKGERLVASAKGRQLVPYIADAVPGWFQPVIKIVDSQGKEIAYCDDYRHNVDPVIITTLPKDDNYTLMIHDAIFRGRQDFNYRIEVGVIPFVTGRYPAYGTVGKSVKQQIEGANLGAKHSSAKPQKAGYNSLTFTNNIGTSNAVSFYALPKSIKLIQYPKEENTLLTLTSAVADSLTAKSKMKHYKIKAEVGVPIIVELIGRRNGSKIDAVMRLRDWSGKIVAEVDDTEDPTQGLMTFHADPVLKYTPTRGGLMTLEVEDLHRGHGQDYHYLLQCHKQLPSFNAFVSPANITIPAGGTAAFRVNISGKVKRPTDLKVKGLPAGFTTSNLRHHGRFWYVSITAPKSAEVKRFPIELKLEYPSSDGSSREVVDVLPVDDMMQAFYYTHHIQAAELALDVAEPSPFRLSLDLDLEKEVLFDAQDEAIPVKIYIDRNPGFNEPIELLLGRKLPIFNLDPISIQPEESEKIVYIRINQSAIAKFKKWKNPPTWQTSIVGTVKGDIQKQGKRTFQNAKYRETTPFFMVKIKK